MVLSLAAAGWLIGVLTVLFMVVCVVLILTVLIQRPQGGGLASEFGSGVGSGQTAFGTKTGDALTIFTIIVLVLFIGAAIGLNYAARPEDAPKTTPTSNETAPADKKDGGQKPADSKSTDAKPTDAKPTDATPADAKPGDGKPAETGAPATPPPAVPTTPPAATPENKPAEQPANPAPSEPKPAEKPADPPKHS